MRDLVLTAFIFGMVPFMLKHAYAGVLMWTWIGLMNPHKLTYGFAYNFGFATLVGIATLIPLVMKEPKKIPWNSVTIAMALWVAWMTFTTFFAFHSAEAWVKWEKVIKIQLMIFVTLMVMGSRHRLELLVYVVVASLGFYGVKGGIFTITHGGTSMVLGPEGSFIEGNTEIALAMIMILPLMRFIQLNTINRWVKHAMTASMILTGAAIIGSYSRGAFVAGGAMALFLFLKSRQRTLVALALIVAIPLLLGVMPREYFERMGTIQTYEEDRSATGRINAWKMAINLTAHYPVTGGGFDTFDDDIFQRYAPEPDNVHDAHSIYFQALGEHGYPGLILFLSILLLAWRTGSRIIRSARGQAELKWARDLAGMIQVCLVGYMVGGAFLGLAYFDLPYILVVILVLTDVVVRKETWTAESKAATSVAGTAASISRPSAPTN